MKQQRVRRFLSVTAASVFACTAVFGAGCFAYAAELSEDTSAQLVMESDGSESSGNEISETVAVKPMLTVQFGQAAYAAGMPLVEACLLWESVSARIPEDAPTDRYIDPLEYATNEERDLLLFGRNDIWISPNGDSIADSLIGTIFSAGNAVRAELEVLDADGNSVWSQAAEKAAADTSKTMLIQLERAFDQSALAEGDYSMIVRAYTDSEDSSGLPQEFRSTFHVDRTAPEVSYSYSEKDGRIILSISATDNRSLQGIAVTGTGAGGLVGSYHPEDADPSAWKDSLLRVFGSRESMQYSQYTETEDSKMLPFILKKLGKLTVADDGSDFNFTDVFAVSPDDYGNYRAEYDVTDLSHFSVVVLDQAYNYYEILSVDDSAEEFVSRTGVWQDAQNGWYEVVGNQLHFISFIDGTVTQYDFSAEKDQLTLSSGNDSTVLNVKYISATAYQMVNKDSHTGFTVRLRDDIAHYTDRSFHSVNDLIEKATADSQAHWGKEVIKADYLVNAPEAVTISLVYEYLDDVREKIREDYYLSVFNGRGNAIYLEYEPAEEQMGSTHFFTRSIDLYEKRLTAIPAGLYFAQHYQFYIQFNEDGKTGRFLYLDAGNDSDFFDLHGNDIPFTYTLDEDGRFEIICRNDKDSISGLFFSDEKPEDVLVLYDRDNEDLNTYEDSFVLITNDSEQIAKLRPMSEIYDLANAYQSAATGRETLSCVCCGTGNCEFNLFFDDPENRTSLFVNIFTLKGKDEFGNSVNLMKPPVMPDNAVYSIAEIKDMSLTDYNKKNEQEPKIVDAVLTNNGKIAVSFRDEQNGVLEKYTISPSTGKGIDTEGRAISLPQTGNTDPFACCVMILALLMAVGGAVVVYKTRKQDVYALKESC